MIFKVVLIKCTLVDIRWVLMQERMLLRFLGETFQGDSEAARKTFREDKQMQERYFAAYTRANHQTLLMR